MAHEGAQAPGEPLPAGGVSACLGIILCQTEATVSREASPTQIQTRSQTMNVILLYLKSSDAADPICPRSGSRLPRAPHEFGLIDRP
jgi:hypothetical protein